jgi:2-polyprenyl-3-methyl-5-hydroxy-6-metoxy-1,4-benzoquinol methylase
MSKNFLLKQVHEFGARQRHLGMERCNDWAGHTAVELKPDSILDVGCYDGTMMARYFKTLPQECHGVECAPEQKIKAELRGMKVASFDLNGRWPYPDDKFDVVFSTQVIEHLHNTRLFVEEMFRVLKPGGTAIVTSENLCSLLNCSALAFFVDAGLREILWQSVGPSCGRGHSGVFAGGSSGVRRRGRAYPRFDSASGEGDF